MIYIPRNRQKMIGAQKVILAIFEEYKRTKKQVLLEDIQKIVNDIRVPFALRMHPEGEKRKPYTLEFRPQLAEKEKK